MKINSVVAYLESGSQWKLDGTTWTESAVFNVKSWEINNGSTLTIGESLPTSLPYLPAIIGYDFGKVVISDGGLYCTQSSWLWKTDVDAYGTIKSIGQMASSGWRWAGDKTFRFFAGSVIDMHHLSFGYNVDFGNGGALVKFMGAGSVIIQFTTKQSPTDVIKIEIQSPIGGSQETRLKLRQHSKS
jgi:hypothetical protein